MLHWFVLFLFWNVLVCDGVWLHTHIMFVFALICFALCLCLFVGLRNWNALGCCFGRFTAGAFSGFCRVLCVFAGFSGPLCFKRDLIPRWDPLKVKPLAGALGSPACATRCMVRRNKSHQGLS